MIDGKEFIQSQSPDWLNKHADGTECMKMIFNFLFCWWTWNVELTALKLLNKFPITQGKTKVLKQRKS